MLNKKIPFFIFWTLLLIAPPCCHALKGTMYDNVSTLLKAMSSKDPKISRKAYDDAGKLEKSDIPALFKELENENSTICATAIDMLVGTINDKEETIGVLKNLLKSERKVVRQGAALRLADIDPSLGKELMTIFIEAVKEESPEYELGAVRALGQIGPEAKDAVPTIIESMKRHPDSAVIHRATLRFIGTPEALEALKPYEQEQARRKKLVKPISMFADSTIGSSLITAAFLGLFLWSRSRRKKGDRIICRPLLIPVFFWGIVALGSLTLGSLAADSFLQGMCGFEIYIGLFIITLVGIIPWLASILWRTKRTASGAPTS